MEHILNAFSQITPAYVLALVGGTIFGYIVGAIPGFSSTMGVALFVPFSYSMNVEIAFAFLIALYCSSIYSGSIPAILINTPGTPSSIATVYDGHPMAKKGQAGRAISLACLASIFGGIFSGILLIACAGSLAGFALKFGPQEYFALSVMGVSMIIGMSEGHLVKGVLSAFIGLAIAIVGMDPVTSFPRYTFGVTQLLSGFQDLPVMVGLFAITEIFWAMSARHKQVYVENVGGDVTNIFAGLRDILKNIWLLIKCSALGTFLGALPGVGTTTAAIMAYNEARRSSKNPELMGTGVPEGIIGPECANNAVAGGAMIPMLALGIPGDNVTAILLGALMIQGLAPGPELFSKYPATITSLYLSLILSYALILILSIFSIRWVIKVLKVPTDVLQAFVLIFCIIGAFALRNSYFDVYVALGCGLLGCAMRHYDIPVTPMILALVLGQTIENRLLVSLQISRGSWLTFVNRPISATLLAITIGFAIFSVVRQNKARARKKALAEGENGGERS